MKTTNEQIRPITQNSSTYHRLTNNTISIMCCNCCYA